MEINEEMEALKGAVAEISASVKGLAEVNQQAVAEAIAKAVGEARETKTVTATDEDLAGLQGGEVEVTPEVRDKAFIEACVLKHYGQDIDNLRTPQYTPNLAAVQKAGNTTDNSEYVPTGFSNQLIDIIKEQSIVAGLFQEVQMLNNPYRFFVGGALSGSAYLVPENTADNGTAVQSRDPGSANVDFDAQTLGVRVVLSKDYVADAVPNVVNETYNQIRYELVQALDNAVTNGQVEGSEFDDTTAGSFTATYDPRYAWSGLRGTCFAQASPLTVEMSTETTMATTLIGAMGSMGKYGNTNDCVVITDYIGLAYLMQADQFLTMDKYGAKAVVLNGQLGTIFGMPVLATNQVPKTAATGYIASSGNTKSNLIVANRRAFRMGVREELTLEQDYSISTRQHTLVGTVRRSFKPVFATTEKLVAIGVGIG